MLTGRCRQFCVSRCSVRGVLPLYPRPCAPLTPICSRDHRQFCPTVRRTRVKAEDLLLTSYTSYTCPISLLPFPRPVLSFTAIIFALHPVVVSEAAAYAAAFCTNERFPMLPLSHACSRRNTCIIRMDTLDRTLQARSTKQMHARRPPIASASWLALH